MFYNRAVSYLCYIDESGCTSALPFPDASALSGAAPVRPVVQPIFAIIGLMIPADRLAKMTREFADVKREFAPGSFAGDARNLDAVLREVKGEVLRRGVRRGGHNRQRAVFGFLDETLNLLERAGARLAGRVWIKPAGGEFNGPAVYTSSVQSVATNFQRLLESRQATGVVVCDHRSLKVNEHVAHSVFTRKFKTSGDDYPRLLDAPLFASSRNHAGLQLADILVSAIISPLAAAVYHAPRDPESPHAHPNYLQLRTRFGQRLAKMQHPFWDDNGQRRRGLWISPGHSRSEFFYAPPFPA